MHNIHELNYVANKNWTTTTQIKNKLTRIISSLGGTEGVIDERCIEAPNPDGLLGQNMRSLSATAEVLSECIELLSKLEEFAGVSGTAVDCDQCKC